jgi:type IV fimbrial biogenesis protein FimT
LITLTIVSIGLAIALPNLSPLLARLQMDAVVSEFTHTLYLARSEAIKRAANVTLCTSVTGKNCTNTGDWQQGWLLFADNNTNKQYDTDEPRIRVSKAVNNAFTLKGNTYVSSSISYLPTGRLSVLGGTINVCALDKSQVGRNIVLIATGRFRVDTGIDCADSL